MRTGVYFHPSATAANYPQLKLPFHKYYRLVQLPKARAVKVPKKIILLTQNPTTTPSVDIRKQNQTVKIESKTEPILQSSNEKSNNGGLTFILVSGTAVLIGFVVPPLMDLGWTPFFGAIGTAFGLAGARMQRLLNEKNRDSADLSLVDWCSNGVQNLMWLTYGVFNGLVRLPGIASSAASLVLRIPIIGQILKARTEIRNHQTGEKIERRKIRAREWLGYAISAAIGISTAVGSALITPGAKPIYGIIGSAIGTASVGFQGVETYIVRRSGEISAKGISLGAHAAYYASNAAMFTYGLLLNDSLIMGTILAFYLLTMPIVARKAVEIWRTGATLTETVANEVRGLFSDTAQRLAGAYQYLAKKIGKREKSNTLESTTREKPIEPQRETRDRSHSLGLATAER